MPSKSSAHLENEVAEVRALRWSGPALQDLKQIRAWVARDSPDSARRLAKRIRSQVESLAEFPKAGRIVPEIGIETYREVIVRPYRAIYEVQNNAVVILRVWHSHRDLPADDE